MAKTKAAEKKSAKTKAAHSKITWLTDEQAAKAAERTNNNDPDWAEGMDHEESVLHPKAINRSC